MHLSRDHRWRRRILRLGLWHMIYRFWFQMHVEGLENVPREGPTIMVVNHMSVVDPPVMVSFAPHGRDVLPLAKIEAFDIKWQRVFATQWGAIPVARGRVDLKAVRAAVEHINSGDIVLLFAEGTRSSRGMQRGEHGSAFLALKTDAVVVPVAIWGTRGFPSSLWREFRTAPIHVCFGQPFRMRPSDGSVSRHGHLERLTDEMMYRIAMLLPAEWRGIYADLKQASADYLELVDVVDGMVA